MPHGHLNIMGITVITYTTTLPSPEDKRLASGEGSVVVHVTILDQVVLPRVDHLLFNIYLK